MAVAVIEPPRPLVTAANIPGFHDASDPFVTAMIAAAQAAIDGPTGPWGLALGIQVLEWETDGFGYGAGEAIRLPYGPVLEPIAVSYRNAAGAWVAISVSGLEVSRSGIGAPVGGWPVTATGEGVVRIRWRAGFAKRDGGAFVPDPPASAVAAVILAAQHLKSLAGQNLFLRSEKVDGVGDQTWTVSEAAGKAIEAATANLMKPLRVFS
ncbi:hypothetical protein [Aureimonas sp. D3]|uniref:hypothetical protein n=1 Tax=Aureimonas sp. D3 TaxID=1638164 RepID=UPI0007810873|nr:hypothetical protein [Aureimonas sp. D3]